MNKKNKKLTWKKLFNKKNFHYSELTNNLLLRKHNISSFVLAKIIYPQLTIKKFLSIKNFLNKNIFIRHQNSILDFGSGNGAFIKFFLEKKISKIFSFEISKELINLQKKIFNLMNQMKKNM